MVVQRVESKAVLMAYWRVVQSAASLDALMDKMTVGLKDFSMVGKTVELKVETKAENWVI